MALFSSMGIASLVIISFLGRSVGTFTVSLKNSEVRLALVEKKDSTNYSTYLHVNENSPYIPRSFYEYKDELISLDNENETSKYTEYVYDEEAVDGEAKIYRSLEFFKYTFYVKNIGYKAASYDMKILIKSVTRADDGSDRGLDDILRVMIFENDPNSEEHNYKVCAKKTPKYANYTNYDINGKETDHELIAAVDNITHETENYRLAEKFDEDGETIAQYNVNNFGTNDIMRYTIVMWLEGDDPQCNQKAPDGATLKIGVDIDAKESK